MDAGIRTLGDMTQTGIECWTDPDGAGRRVTVESDRGNLLIVRPLQGRPAAMVRRVYKDSTPLGSNPSRDAAGMHVVDDTTLVGLCVIRCRSDGAQ